MPNLPDFVGGESGIFTPSLGGSGGESGQVYSTRLGRYTRIAPDLVYVHAVIGLTTLGTITGNVRFKNLPFPCATISFRQGIVLWDATVTLYGYMCGIFIPDVGECELRAVAAPAAGLSVVAQANLQNGTTLILSGIYQTKQAI